MENKSKYYELDRVIQEQIGFVIKDEDLSWIDVKFNEANKLWDINEYNAERQLINSKTCNDKQLKELLMPVLYED